MKPFGPTIISEGDGPAHQLAADAAALKIRIGAKIENKGVNAAIPGNVDKSDEPVSLERSEMAEAALEDRRERPCWRRAPGAPPELIKFCLVRKGIDPVLGQGRSP
ncbi:MAG: hypothetical protein K0R85_2624 [Devosia sp.]|nr:hypothetical protein [Devosia sp.]